MRSNTRWHYEPNAEGDVILPGEQHMVFLEIAVAAIGIGIVLMVGYLVIAQVRAALPVDTGNATLDNEVEQALTSAQTTVFAGFGLIAVGIIVLAAFGLISVFK